MSFSTGSWYDQQVARRPLAKARGGPTFFKIGFAGREASIAVALPVEAKRWKEWVPWRSKELSNSLTRTRGLAS
jgi:hypothetical protein